MFQAAARVKRPGAMGRMREVADRKAARRQDPSRERERDREESQRVYPTMGSQATLTDGFRGLDDFANVET